MKNTFKFKRNIAKDSALDCVMLCLSLATLSNGINIPFVSKTLFFFFTFMALHIAFVQIRHKLHKNKKRKNKEQSSGISLISRVIQSPASYHITSRSQRLVHIFMYIKL